VRLLIYLFETASGAVEFTVISQEMEQLNEFCVLFENSLSRTVATLKHNLVTYKELRKRVVVEDIGVAIAGGQKTTLVRRDGNSCARFSIHGVGCWSLEGQSGWDQMDRRASRAVAGVLRASDC
jgi:hypothetical protein